MRPPTLLAQGLNFPTSVAFDNDCTAWVAESGLPFGGSKPGGRVLRIEPDGHTVPCLSDLKWPVNGLTFLDGTFYISEGGNPGRISRWTPGGERETVLDGLPGLGNYHTNMTAVGPDGMLYFSQGAMTNSGVIGLDAYELGWLKRLPHNFDIPGYDVVMTGHAIETDNPLNPEVAGAKARTGGFSSFNETRLPGERIPGRVPCTASVMKCRPDGSGLELVAWGLRSAYGLVFLPDGRLLATEQGPDDRGSRPVGGAPDMLVEVKPGRWYGWPDYVGTVPVTDPRFLPHKGPQPEFLLANHDELPRPERPLLDFAVNAAATKLTVIPENSPRWPGQLLVALFGDERPLTGPPGPKVGRSLARIDPADWSLHALKPCGLNRPIDVKIHPEDGTVYVLDFGDFEMAPEGVTAQAGTGKLWKFSMDSL